tara:strand:- start:6551 stop:7042 length:492 start_codon:yes stop_codon:yes gene_type:complete
MMRILGIDPGYDRVGVAIVEKSKNEKEVVLFSDCIQTDKKETFQKRLLVIGNIIEKIIKKWKPTILSLETLYMHKNQKTAMRVAEARGAILFIAAKQGLAITEYTPLQIKEAITGYGRAPKDQIAQLLAKTINLENRPYIDDELDAIATALTGMYYTMHNLST